MAKFKHEGKTYDDKNLPWVRFIIVKEDDQIVGYHVDSNEFTVFNPRMVNIMMRHVLRQRRIYIKDLLRKDRINEQRRERQERREGQNSGNSGNESGGTGEVDELVN